MFYTEESPVRSYGSPTKGGHGIFPLTFTHIRSIDVAVREPYFYEVIVAEENCLRFLRPTTNQDQLYYIGGWKGHTLLSSTFQPKSFPFLYNLFKFRTSLIIYLIKILIVIICLLSKLMSFV